MIRQYLFGGAAIFAMALPQAALAQNMDSSSQQDGANGPGDIVVTARRRDETSLSVPVVVAGVGQAEINRRNITSVENIARIVPQLIIGDASGSVQGGTISLRGIGSPDANPFSDSAVSFNVDGAQIARASVRRMGEMDLAQIEVLKGPQALFFGKNSPAGILVLKSADPTPDFRMKLTGGYEAYADEFRTDGYISGPLTSTLGARLAFMASTMKGYINNIATPTADFGPVHQRVPRNREIGGRLTLKFDPGDSFTAKLKFSYGHVRSSGLAQTQQPVHCPTGVSGYGDGTECRADENMTRADLGPAFAAAYPDDFGSRVPYAEQTQMLGVLDMNYNVSDTLKLSSLTSYYHIRFDGIENFNNTVATSANLMIASHNSYGIDEFAQELRLASDFDGPLNFLIGGFAQKSKLKFGSLAARNALAPVTLLDVDVVQRGTSYSAFAQASLKPIDSIELSAGGRYSYERKRFFPFTGTGTPIVTQKNRDSWKDFSPEFTAAWRPSSKVTLFGSYKRGFLSGGFNGGSGNLTLDRSYDQQKVRGFETGIKGLLLDDTLRVNLAAYTYQILGLQVASTIDVNQFVTNAASARTKGIEFDANWTTPAEGLSLHGGVSYNRARYSSYNAPCYAGQTIMLGCNRNLSATTGAFTAQSLAGSQLTRAPAWGVALGYNYEIPVSDGMKFAISTDANYSSGYFTDATNKPASRQDGYWLVDAAIRGISDRGYEIALIGRNLTNQYYVQRTVDRQGQGSGTGRAGTSVLADTAGSVNRGREIWLRFTIQLDKLIR